MWKSLSIIAAAYRQIYADITLRSFSTANYKQTVDALDSADTNSVTSNPEWTAFAGKTRPYRCGAWSPHEAIDGEHPINSHRTAWFARRQACETVMLLGLKDGQQSYQYQLLKHRRKVCRCYCTVNSLKILPDIETLYLNIESPTRSVWAIYSLMRSFSFPSHPSKMDRSIQKAIVDVYNTSYMRYSQLCLPLCPKIFE